MSSTRKYCRAALPAIVFIFLFVSWSQGEEGKPNAAPVTAAEEDVLQAATPQGTSFGEAPPAAKVVDLAKRERKKPLQPEGNFEEAMRRYDEGKLDEAQAILEKIARENPVDAESRRYLKSVLSIKRKWAARDQNTVERDRILDVRRNWLLMERPEEEMQPEEQVDPKTARRKLMEQKLQQIIPEINFTDANLRDVLAYLSKISGINILLDEGLAEGAEEPAQEEVEAGEDAEEAQATPGTKKERGGGTGGIDSGVTIALKNIPLIEVLKYILTPKGLKYRIDEYAVVIATPARLEEGDMETRYYHLSSGSSTFVSVRRDSQDKETAGQENPSLTVKEVLEQSGVPFPTGSKILLDARTGTLIVRNNPANLAVIEKIIKALDITPFQVAIESKFVDIEETTARELGLETFFTRNVPLSLHSGTGNTVISSRAGSETAGQFTSSTSDYEGLSHGLRFLEDSSGNPAGNIFSFASILTQPQFQVILHALDQSGMANILSAPKVTTANNEQAKIKVVTELFYPTQFEITPATTNDQGSVVTPPVVIPGGFTSRDVGIQLEVTPSVGADKKAISLTLIPEVSTLSGWQNFGIVVGSNFPAIPILQPIFTSKNVTASIVINDTETVVLGGLIKDETTTTADKIPILGDIPILGNPFRSHTESSTKKNLLIFVTAYLLSPEGETISGPYYRKTKIFNP